MSRESYDCSEECRFQGGTGTLNTQLGICDCLSIIDPRSVCTDDCLECRPSSSIEKVDGQFIITVTNCLGIEIYREAFLDMYSFGSDINNPQNFQLVSFPADGSIQGSLLFDDQETVTIFNELSQAAANVRRKRDLESYEIVNGRFRRQSTDSLPQNISNPLLCLQLNEAIVFQISQDTNSSSVHYPVYIKEHLLNSNPGFDYGAFRQLANFILSGVNISQFVYTFSEAGSYYFQDSIITSSQMVVTVMQDGVTCERDGQDFRVLPSSSTYLIQYGVVSQPILSQEPNFAAILGIMATCLLILCIVVLGILIWRPRSIGIKIPNSLKPKYRRLDEPQIIYVGEVSKDIETRGVGVGAPAPTEHPFQLENFNVKTFYDKLEDQTLHVSAQLARQQADLVRFYDQILQQTETLKSLVSESQVRITVERNRQFQRENVSSQSIDQIEPIGSESSTSSQRGFYSSSQEAEMMVVLKEILAKLKKSNQKTKPTLQKVTIPSDDRITQQVQNDLKEVADEMEALVRIFAYNYYRVFTILINFMYDFQELNNQFEVEKESISLVNKLIGTTSEEEALKILNEHDHQMKLIDARNERTRMEQMESFKKKLDARQKKQRTAVREVCALCEILVRD